MTQPDQKGQSSHNSTLESTLPVAGVSGVGGWLIVLPTDSSGDILKSAGSQFKIVF